MFGEDEDLLRGLVRCRRCHAKMHGTAGRRDLKARYYCLLPPCGSILLRSTDHSRARRAKPQFLSLIFENVWLEQDRVVAVQPKPSFLPYFERKELG